MSKRIKEHQKSVVSTLRGVTQILEHQEEINLLYETRLKILEKKVKKILQKKEK